MKVLYTRVSTSEQNLDRQILNEQGYDKVIKDSCSGTVPFFERPNGKNLKKLIEQKKVTEIHVHSIDRFGRNAIDVFNVWKELTDMNVILQCHKPYIRNFDDNGKIDAFSQLLMGILVSMADFERSLIKERQMEGIAIRKQKGLYAGRLIGSKDTTDRFLRKPKNQLIIEHLKKSKNSYQEIAKIVGCSTATITKVKRTLDELNKQKEAV